MVLEDLVPDFNPKKIVSPIHPYLGCMYGKQYKASYKSDPLKQHSKTPEKFIDGDVSSKVATPSLHGSLYYILYKDDFSLNTTLFTLPDTRMMHSLSSRKSPRLLKETVATKPFIK